MTQCAVHGIARCTICAAPAYPCCPDCHHPVDEHGTEGCTRGWFDPNRPECTCEADPDTLAALADDEGGPP